MKINYRKFYSCSNYPSYHVELECETLSDKNNFDKLLKCLSAVGYTFVKTSDEDASFFATHNFNIIHFMNTFRAIRPGNNFAAAIYIEDKPEIFYYSQLKPAVSLVDFYREVGVMSYVYPICTDAQTEIYEYDESMSSIFYRRYAEYDKRDNPIMFSEKFK